MQLHRSSRDKLLSGVCAGIAENIGIDVLFIRLLFVFLLIYGGSTFWIYLVLWIILPVIDIGDEARAIPRFYRSRRDKLLGGVCGGLAISLRSNSTTIRLVVIALAILGFTSVLPYLVLWVVSPMEPEN